MDLVGHGRLRLGERWTVEDGVPWYHHRTTGGRQRGKWCTCVICGVTFSAQLATPGLYCTRSCQAHAMNRKRGYRGRPGVFSPLTPAAAWLAGVIWADGCLADRPDLKAGGYVSLSSADREIAEHAGAIGGVEARCYPDRRGCSPAWRVQFGHPRVIADLRALGLTPRKTHTATLPALDPELMPHFVRGYFDGDGCVSTAPSVGRRILRCNVSGSAAFLTALSEVLVERGICTPRRLHPNKSIWRIMLGHRDSVRLAGWMYSGGGPCLPRKRAIFEALREA